MIKTYILELLDLHTCFIDGDDEHTERSIVYKSYNYIKYIIYVHVAAYNHMSVFVGLWKCMVYD